MPRLTPGIEFSNFVLHLESGIPDAETLLNEARDRDGLRIGRLPETHPVVQMVKGPSRRPRSRITGTINELRQENPQTKRRYTDHCEKRGTCTKSSYPPGTQDGPVGGMEVERGNLALRMAIGAGPTSTKRDATILAVHNALTRFAKDNIIETWNNILKRRVLARATQDILPFAEGGRLRVRTSTRESDSRLWGRAKDITPAIPPWTTHAWLEREMVGEEKQDGEGHSLKCYQSGRKRGEANPKGTREEISWMSVGTQVRTWRSSGLP